MMMQKYFITLLYFFLLTSTFMTYAHASFDRDQVIGTIQKYHPIYYFHPQEKTSGIFPSDAESAYLKIEQQQAFEHTPKDYPHIDVPVFFSYLEEKEQHNIKVRLKYWLWYNYNYAPLDVNVPFFNNYGNHDGDWESIEVVLCNDRPVAYLLSNHEVKTTRVFDLNKKESLAKLEFEDGHLKTWVALGSHSHYEKPLNETIAFSFDVGEYLYDNYGIYIPFLGVVYSDKLPPRNSTIIWYPTIFKNIEDTNFSNYEGNWGKPVSPVVRQREYDDFVGKIVCP